MYRQILIDAKDRDYQRILWVDQSNKTREYQLSTVTYGTTSAPFQALRVIQQLVSDKGDAFPLAAPILQNDIYVDDILFGAEDVPLLQQSRIQLCALLARGGFALRKWASNRAELLTDISSEDHGLACDKELKLNESLYILGISWNPVADSFTFQVSLSDLIPRMKRRILSAIAKLFDPLGWVTPVIVAAKIFMQQLWRIKLDWDEEISFSAMSHWETIYKNLEKLNGLCVDRWTGRGADTAYIELHGFADASTVAYAAAVYMRVVSISGEITIQLLAAKSRVAPLKTISIPRLELSAAGLLVRVLEFVQTTLNLNQVVSVCWTNSTVTLAWIQSHPSRWKTFVSNRVADIQTRVPRAQWRHVATRDNPADCASRGILGADLKSASLWWQGPPWLHLDSTEWPSSDRPLSQATNEEEKPSVIHLTRINESWDLADRFSSWTKLLRVTAYILRFIRRCQQKENPPDEQGTSIALTAQECRAAQNFWIREIQRTVFKEELNCLIEGRALSPRSSMIALAPFLDENCIIRVGGRIQQAPLPARKKHPILLRAHPIVELIIRHTHLNHLHSGVQLTLTALCQQFWIIKARNKVKQVIHKCVTCARERAAIPQQIMGQMLHARISTPVRAFEHCGVDYAGPITMRTSSGRGHKSHKGYIALFICLASRAIHLELVSSYSTSAFLDAFSRFTARRGLPSTMYSDNGTTFTGANNELKQAYRDAINNKDFLNKTAADKIDWRFIPPHAPHFGGLWEAGVRSVKHHLRRVLGTHTLTFEELSTLLCRIEACLNSRPISPLSDTIDDYETLTPGHFLIGSALTVNPETSVLSIAENRLTRWQIVRQLTERFWRIWQNDYVNTLQQRSKWRVQQPTIKPGTMVLIRNPLLPPCKWELGRVIECHSGPDGVVRVVSVRTANSEFKRPLVKLCILPIDVECSGNSSKCKRT